MVSQEKLPEAIDLSHHLSAVSKARPVSPLKGLQKYMGTPGLISLAGGLPNAEYFPFSSISGEALVADSFPLSESTNSSAFSWLWKLFGSGENKARTSTFTVDKYPAHDGDLNLATALQYGMATGLVPLQEIIKEFTERVFQPGYKDFACLVHTGNTDAWSKVVQTLCNPGEFFITSEWTYPSALAGCMPYGLNPVPIAMDSQGMRADDLRKTLAEWDEKERGKPRPHIMYTVPVGQNPTGACMEEKRKKEIYAVCVEYDVIIVEDDPYYFLQFGPYVTKKDRGQDSDPIYQASQASGDKEWIASLAPSYLKFDYQGRVVRLDTFSKTVAPGSRLGWFTCNKVFAERLERQGETSTQAPCGFGQICVTSLLNNWHYDGYVRWLKALRIQYKQRRDFFIDALAEEFNLELAPSASGIWDGADVYRAYLKPEGSFLMSEKYDRKAMFSFVPPLAGMFLWLKLSFEHHPSFDEEGPKNLEEKLFIKLAEAGVLFGPGRFFSATPLPDEVTEDGHFRISFSNSSPEEVKKAVKIFGQVMRKFMKGL